MIVSLFLTREGSKMTNICLISSVFLFVFDITGFCSGVLVDQAFPLDAFVFSL